MKRRSARTKAPARVLHVGRHRDVAHESLAEPQQSAALEDRRGQRVAAGHQVFDRNRLARADARDQAEVGRGEQADVVGVLPVQAFEAFGDDQPHAGRLLGGRAVLARGALAIAPARDHDLDARRADGIGADGKCLARLEAGVGVAAQLVVVVREDRKRRDLVGRHIVTQRRRVGEVEGRSLQAQFDHACGTAQEENARPEPDAFGAGGGWRGGWHAPMLAGHGGAIKRSYGTGDLAIREIGDYPCRLSMSAATARGCGVLRRA
jgi:hypothetical protein